MSGGGAKGLYHVGVLKALEENDIPIDYISGTSMGAIVGGLYAAGYTPEKIAADFSSPMVTYWMAGEIEPKYQYYIRQMDNNGAILSLRFDPQRKKMIIPSELISTGQIDMAIVEYFAQANQASRGNFDSLMIPFRCVATDAKNRKTIVFDSGDLGKAIRASMSLPFAFKPVEDGDALLYDGGMTNNFPYQPLIEDFNPDVLIGSKCTEGFDTSEDASIMEQAFNLTMVSTSYELPEGNNILINRDMRNYSVFDFDKAEEIIALGYDDAMEKMDSIKILISRRQTAAERSEKRAKFYSREPEFVFNSYTVEGIKEKQKEYVEDLLGFKRDEIAGYSFQKFSNQYFKLLSTKEFESSFPGVEYDSLDKAFKLKLNLKTKPNFKLMFGGNISSTALNQAYVGMEYERIGVSSHNYGVDGYFSPFYVSAHAKGRIDFHLKVPMYVKFGVLLNHYDYYRSNFGFISKHRSLTYSKYNDNYFYASLGWGLSRHVVMNAQFNAGIDDAKYDPNGISSDAVPTDRSRFSFLGGKIEVERNSIPNAYSNRGIKQSISVIGISGREDYFPEDDIRQGSLARRWLGASFRREQYYSLPSIKWLSAGYYVNTVYTNRPSFITENATNFTSPSFTPTPHSKIVYLRQFRSTSFIAAGVMPSFDFTSKLYLKTSVYGFMPFDNERLDNDTKRVRYIFDASLIYQTIIGPVSISLSKYDTDKDNLFLTFNFGIAIFNKKGLFY